MRFRSARTNGFRIFAVSGTNTISFAIEATAAAKKGLLGFAVERAEGNGAARRMPGFKVFRSIVPKPDRNTRVSTWDHPVQSFVWDDFTGKPDTPYTYTFRPLRGTPQKLDRSAPPVAIKTRTEALYSRGEHDVFFNRGVASSQAYARRFGNVRPSRLKGARQKQALQWLTRDLDEAIVKFIASARSSDGLLCCFYEFHYTPVVDALKAAIDAGVDVRIIIDAKVNGRKDKNGKKQPSFPREENFKAIKAAGINRSRIIERDANPSNIQHNKFMVLLKGNKTPTEVWTGSTNLSESGFSGQTNVGHWLRNKVAAKSFRDYWEVLEKNEGSRKGDDRITSRTHKEALRKMVHSLCDLPATPVVIPKGITTVFSPRKDKKALALYVDLVDTAKSVSCVTLAFGINALFKDVLLDHDGSGQIVFLLLEKEDKPNPRSKKPFVSVNARNNVYKAWGSQIDDPIYQWVRETNTKRLKISHHVSYIHSKFLLADPLGADPIVVTGSANFSPASSTDNDENMLIIRGNKRVADIYFTEFNRLFNHYYFRAVHEKLRTRRTRSTAASLFLDETGRSWVKKYESGTLRAKRLAIYTSMR